MLVCVIHLNSRNCSISYRQPNCIEAHIDICWCSIWGICYCKIYCCRNRTAWLPTCNASIV
nr:MAG TPA: hypothetical protein [Caudoviricetes sp.]